MKNTPVLNKKTVLQKATIEPIDYNLSSFQYFYLSLISILLLVNILFENGVTLPIINRAWGMNNFSYFPWWVQALIFTLLYTLAIPTINNNFRVFIQKLTLSLNGKSTGNSKKILWFIGISLGISLLLYLFRVKYDLLGDMDLRVSQSVNGNYVDDEYLTMYGMHYICIVLQKFFHLLPHQTFVLTSIASGFLFSFFGLLIADLLFSELYSFIILFLFYITIGTTLVFCGYTEIYAIPAVSASLYIYSALLFLKNRVNIVLPFLSLVLAMALHKEQISLLPSFIFIAARKFPFLHKLNIKLILLLFIISIPLIYLLNSILHLQELMPLTKDDQFPALNTLFSPSYWWELFNSQYISSGILLFLFFLILFQTVKGRIKLDDYSKFLLIAVLFIYSIVITMNKMRGSGDWDVCSFPAIYLSMFIGYVTLTQWKIIYTTRKSFYIISLAILLNLLSSCTWIGLNSAKKSLDKIEDIVLTDPGYYYARLPAEIELSVLFNKYGTHDQAMKYYKLSYDKFGTEIFSSVNNYAGMLLQDKDTNQAVNVLEKSVASFPSNYEIYNQLFKIYVKKNEFGRIYDLSKLYVAQYDKNPKPILGDSTGKEFLISCLTYLYRTSMARHDTFTNNYTVIRMKQLNIRLTAK